MKKIRGFAQDRIKGYCHKRPTARFENQKAKVIISPASVRETISSEPRAQTGSIDRNLATWEEIKVPAEKVVKMRDPREVGGMKELVKKEDECFGIQPCGRPRLGKTINLC